MTGIGSLPMTDPHEAVEFVAQVCPEVPFWPQLPQRDERERMIEQAFAPFSSMLAPRRGKGYGYVIKREWLTEFLRALESGPAQLDETHAAGFFAFERMLQAGRLRAARALKGQIVGPVTLALQLFLDEADDVPLVFKSGDSLGDIVIPAINWYVTRLALWQIERLQLFGRPVILMLDEPCLSFLPARILDVSTSTEMTARSSALTKALRESLTMIRVAGAIAGLHCCSRPPFATVRYVHPALFSFDAYQWLDVFRTDPDAHAFVRQGGMLAFGLIPTWSDLSSLDATTLLAYWLSIAGAAQHADIARLARHSMITATCGMGLLTDAAARQSFQLARRVASGVARIVHEPDDATAISTVEMADLSRLAARYLYPRYCQ